MISGSKDALKAIGHDHTRTNEQRRHHLWGKSERAIFAIITSLLLPIFVSKLPTHQWGKGEMSYDVIFLV
jgi:hypothetical protein